MNSSVLQFIIYAGIFVISFSVVFGYVKYMKKLRPSARDSDVSIWRLQAISWCVGAVLFFNFTFVPFRAYIPHFNASESNAAAITDLVEMQKDTMSSFNELRDNVKLMTFILGVYIFLVGSMLHKVQTQRNEELLKENPELKKPLGL